MVLNVLQHFAGKPPTFAQRKGVTARSNCHDIYVSCKLCCFAVEME